MPSSPSIGWRRAAEPGIRITERAVTGERPVTASYVPGRVLASAPGIRARGTWSPNPTRDLRLYDVAEAKSSLSRKEETNSRALRSRPRARSDKSVARVATFA